jgi:hypothetical protein
MIAIAKSDYTRSRIAFTVPHFRRCLLAQQ